MDANLMLLPTASQSVRRMCSCKVRMSAFLGPGGPMEVERIELTAKEHERLKVLHEVERGHLPQIDAARGLRFSDRQVRRLLQRLRQVRGSRAGAWTTRMSLAQEERLDIRNQKTSSSQLRTSRQSSFEPRTFASHLSAVRCIARYMSFPVKQGLFSRGCEGPFGTCTGMRWSEDSSCSILRS